MATETRSASPTTTPPDVGDEAPNLSLADSTGQLVALADLWAERPLVLAFVRHFGCSMCREYVSELRDAAKSLADAGGDVAVVTMGTPEQATQFRESYQLPFRVLSDPERASYAAFGLTAGNLWQLLGPQNWRKGFPAVARFGVGVPTGNPMQRAGTFVIDTAGVFRLVQRPGNAVDHPRLDELERAVRAAAQGSV